MEDRKPSATTEEALLEEEKGGGEMFEILAEIFAILCEE